MATVMDGWMFGILLASDVCILVSFFFIVLMLFHAFLDQIDPLHSSCYVRL